MSGPFGGLDLVLKEPLTVSISPPAATDTNPCRMVALSRSICEPAAPLDDAGIVSGLVELSIVLFSIVRPPVPVASIVPLLMTALWLRVAAGRAVIIDDEGEPAGGVDHAGLFIDQHELLVASTDIAGAGDRAVIVQLGVRAPGDRSLAMKLKRAVAFEPYRSVERRRTAQVQRTELMSVYGAPPSAMETFKKGALTLGSLNDAAVAGFQSAVADERLFEVDRLICRPAGADNAAVGAAVVDAVFKKNQSTGKRRDGRARNSSMT